MKVHWVSAMAVMLVGMALPLPLSARAALLLAVALVVALEVLNAALEAIVDLATETWAFPAKRAKDAAAGAVLVVALGAAAVLLDVVVHHWADVRSSRHAVVRTVVFGVPLLAFLGALLALPRRRVWLFSSGFGALACFAPLAWHAEDPGFTAVGLILLVGAGAARARQPALLDRQPPPGA